MPAIYQSFTFSESDTIEQRQGKLYLGMISCGEDAYSLGAAIAECRKTLDTLNGRLAALDAQSDAIRKEFHSLREKVRKNGN